MDVGVQKSIKEAARTAFTRLQLENVQQQKAAAGGDNSAVRINLRMSAMKPIVPSILLASL